MNAIHSGIKISQLVIKDVISSGGMAIIVRAVTPRGDEIAVKIARPDKSGDPFYSTKLNNEVETLRRLQNIPGVIQLVRMDWERKPSYIAVAVDLPGYPSYYAMELLHGTSLERHLKTTGKFSAGEAVAVAMQVAEILARIHQKLYAHNDIKVDNIVFRNALVKGGTYEPVLIDFGISVRVSKSFDGIAPSYAAPEKLEVACRRKPPDSLEDPMKTDVWSLGIILYQMITGRLPYEGKTPAAVLDSIRRRSLPPVRSIVPEVPIELNEFIMEDCLAEKPSRRPTAEQMARCLGPFSSNIVLKVKPKGLFGQ